MEKEKGVVTKEKVKEAILEIMRDYPSLLWTQENSINLFDLSFEPVYRGINMPELYDLLLKHFIPIHIEFSELKEKREGSVGGDLIWRGRLVSRRYYTLGELQDKLALDNARVKIKKFDYSRITTRLPVEEIEEIEKGHKAKSFTRHLERMAKEDREKVKEEGNEIGVKSHSATP